MHFLTFPHFSGPLSTITVEVLPIMLKNRFGIWQYLFRHIADSLSFASLLPSSDSRLPSHVTAIIFPDWSVSSLVENWAFLDASTHLYKRVHPYVRPSVGPSVRRSVGPSVCLSVRLSVGHPVFRGSVRPSMGPWVRHAFFFNEPITGENGRMTGKTNVLLKILMLILFFHHPIDP